MQFTIIDCYTDEPSGLGVPPYLSTYPRYVAGAILNSGHKCTYLTIDDMRLLCRGKGKETLQTNIKIKNVSKNNAAEILSKTDIIVVVSGVQTPGKYLSALPGTIAEVREYVKQFKCLKVLTGPAAMAGEGLWGGRVATTDYKGFDMVIPHFEFKLDKLLLNNFTTDVSADLAFQNIAKISIAGAKIVTEHPDYPEFLI